MKAVLLVGGRGTRLLPRTEHVSKHLLDVGGLPMVAHPLRVLRRAGVTDLRLVCNPGEAPTYLRIVHTLEPELTLSATTQPEPGGIAQAVALAADQLRDGGLVMLGDNLLTGPGLDDALVELPPPDGAVVWTRRVADPRQYGVIEVHPGGRVLSLQEKPSRPRSDRALVGLYAFDGSVVERVQGLEPSARGELEMVDLLRRYADDARLAVRALPEDVEWLDMGTHEDLARAEALLALFAQDLQIPVEREAHRDQR